MELLNATKMVAGQTMGMRPDGRESLVVVVKGTFTLPATGKEATLAEKQLPLVEADVFTGEPGFSAPLYESEYAPHKPRCDVLLSGSAYAPGGKPAERVTVSLRVGSLEKSFDVVGKRVWTAGILGPTPSRPEPFTVMPFSYNSAFGGVDKTRGEDPQQFHWYLPNPFGQGYYDRVSVKAIDGKPLPNTEECGRPVKDPSGSYQPMAFGPIARVWQPRRTYAGTYDQNWLDNVFPLLPTDFDERYFQSAPEDQQLDHLQGGEEVELVNLTADGVRRFSIPARHIPVEFCRLKRESETVTARLDNVYFEPDQNRFTLCWRAAVALRKNIFEIPRGIVGRMPAGWYRARSIGKVYYPNLRELIASKAS